MKDIIIPLQNCLGLPLEEKDVGTWEKELPSLYPSRKAHQLQDGRFIPVRHLILVDKYLPKASYNATIMHFHHKEKRAHTIPTSPPPPTPKRKTSVPEPKMSTQNPPTFRLRIHSSSQVTTDELPYVLHPIL